MTLSLLVKSFVTLPLIPAKWLAAALTIASLSAPAAAQDDGIEWDGLIELRGVESELEIDEGEGIDTSGFGARARLGVTFDLSDHTSVRAEGEAAVFDFRDSDRDTLETKVARVTITHQLSDEVEVRGFARRHENIAVLEALSADQTSVGARVQWQEGNDRVRVTAEYRERDYDTTIGGDSDGYRVAAQYNRRLGSYNWLRFDLRTETNRSDNEPRRSFDRQVARVKYSVPIAKRLRFRPSVEYRQWDYDARIAQGDPEGDLRRDSYVGLGTELAWGRATRGLYATARAEYRLRQSNDERFDRNNLRIGVRVGVRF